MNIEPETYPMPAFPTLTTSDIEASRRFYVGGLGFQHVFSIPGPDGATVVEHLRFSRYADVLLEREQPGSGLAAAERGRGVRLSFSLPLANRKCDEFVERARSHGARLEGSLVRPWNAREVVVTDPDGYVLVFSEPQDLTKTFDEVLKDVAAGPEILSAPAD